MIRILKASAGSGKTYNLARKYIELLFSGQDRYSYRHILAVTFTNKATDEMKGRILQELFCLADSPQDSDYLEYFVPKVFSDVAGLQKAADEILCNLLHDYSAFSVSTIDRFFQQTLKAFSREIGQFSSYQVELDKESLISESVDRVLDALTENDTEKRKWLTDSALEQIEQGGRYNLESGLLNIAVRLKSDEHREMTEKYGIDVRKTYSRENLSAVKKECTGVIREFGTAVGAAAERVAAALTEAGIDAAESNRHFLTAVYGYCPGSQENLICKPAAGFMTKAADPERWFPKAKKKLLERAYPVLKDPLDEFCALFDAPYRTYRTAVIIRSQLYGLGLAGDIDREFNALMKERNVLSIDDSNTILKDIIAGSDAPFVYEKTGVRYDSFLLDEFQDTSRIQWENFLPLLKESEGKGCESLVVGDVKQSIYRWRGSDWNLLAGELTQAFDRTTVSTLDTNYRSCRNVVEFNNSFFKAVSDRMDRMYNEGLEPDRHTDAIERIYSDVEQKCASSEAGSVDLTFCAKEMTLQKVLDAVNEAMDCGASPGDVAVLVRNNASGSAVAGFLIENGIRVVTDDSLKVKSSVIVRRLVSLLSSVANPSDSISRYMSSSLDVCLPEEYGPLVSLCEFLLRELRDRDEDLFCSEVLYIQSFMDCVSDYMRLEGNSLKGFLQYWAEADPAIASPDAGDSVRVMTIHKSKGLDFPYVIVPFIEKVTLFKSDRHWCCPDFSGTALSDACRNIYDVFLSSESDSTLFAGDYREELLKQYTDNINVMYVALTRARSGMHLIGEMPSERFVSGLTDGQWQNFSDFSQALYCHVRSEVRAGSDVRCIEQEDGSQRFSIGSIVHDWRKRGGHGDAVRQLEVSYPSWPVNPVDGMPRLLLSRHRADFFSEDGDAGVMASGRIRGIVLHEILSRVSIPSDIDKSVRQAVLDGSIDSIQAREAVSMLSDRIASAVRRGWFRDDAAVYSETDIIDTDGSVHRPDRVEISADGMVRIIDYKFGREKPEYLEQVSLYADIYRRMGYGNVEPAVWYVLQDHVAVPDTVMKTDE